MKQVQNNSLLMLVGLAVLGIAVPVASTKAENVTQTIELVRVDVQSLSTGFRTSKLIGSSILNDEGESIGKIDELIVSPDDNKTAYVVLSVGGWLGMGTHLVALPYDSLKIMPSKISLPGATKEKLKTLPEFKYKTI